jgi:hypothetical protein
MISISNQLRFYQGVLAVAKRNVAEPSVAVDRVRLPAFDLLLDARQVDAGEIFLDEGVGGRLAHEDEAGVLLAHRLAKRLAGEQVVAQVDRVQSRVARAVGGQPAFGGLVLAVLLVRPILRRHELRRQRHDLVVAWGHERRAQHGVVIFRSGRFALAPKPGRAVGAMDGLRTMVFRPVQRDQNPPAQPPEHIQAPRRPLQLIHRLVEHRPQQRRRGSVQHVSDVIVAGDLRDAVQALAVGPPEPFLEPPLMGQEGRALHVKHRERRHPDLAHAIAHVQSTPLVREPVQASAQRTKQGLQRTHRSSGILLRTPRESLMARPPRVSSNLWHSRLTSTPQRAAIATHSN